MPYLAVEGDRKIYYEHHRGRGPAVVLVHAWGMTCRLWDRVTQELTLDGREVVLLDERGCGHSDKDFEDFSVKACGEDIVKLVDHLGLERPVLNGWSIGGAMVTVAGAALGDRLGGFVSTVGATPRFTASDDFPNGTPLENAEATLEGLRTARPDTALGVSRAICHAETVVSETVVHWMYEMFAATSPRADETLADLAHNVDLTSELKSITAPALIFGGRGDVFVNHDACRDGAEMMQNAKFVSCPRSGHAPPLEEPDLYLSELRAFLDALVPVGGAV